MKRTIVVAIASVLYIFATGRPVAMFAQTQTPPQSTVVSTGNPSQPVQQTQSATSPDSVSLKDILTLTLSAFAILISSYTAYRTFWARFKGNVWSSDRIVLAHIDSVPSLGLACFFENSGAKPGILDDLRVRVDQKESATVSYFYPMLMRADYSIFRAYTESDWYPFSIISFTPYHRAEKYLLLKPLNDKFTSVKGEMDVSLEIRWHGNKRWDVINPHHKFSLLDQIASNWNDSSTPAYQIISDEEMSHRRQ